jgi:hypothetical protein
VVVLDTDDLVLRQEATVPATAWEPGWGEGEPVKAGEQIHVGARSLVVLQHVD